MSRQDAPPEEDRGGPAAAAPAATARGPAAPAEGPLDLNAGAAAARPEAAVPVVEPRVLGESKFDRVSSALLAFVIGASLGVAFLFLMYLAEQAFNRRAPAPIEIIEVAGGGGGGSPDGTPGATEAMNIAGAEAGAQASNNMEEASSFEEPAVEMTSTAVIDALAEAPPDQMTDVDIADILPNAGAIASGKKTSKIGTGKSFGFGPGPGGGFTREQRWVIVFKDGQTLDEYARQLDFLGVELATPTSTGGLDYASKFAAANPVRRTGLAAADQRLYFLWQGAGRKTTDVQLLARAGVTVGNKPIFQFYPKAVEDILVDKEVRFAGRQPGEIRSTRFQVVSAGNGYDVKVISQEPLGPGT